GSRSPWAPGRVRPAENPGVRRYPGRCAPNPGSADGRDGVQPGRPETGHGGRAGTGRLGPGRARPALGVERPATRAALSPPVGKPGRAATGRLGGTPAVARGGPADRARAAGPAVPVPGPVDAVRRRPTGRRGRRPALGAGRDAAGPSLTTGGEQGPGPDHRSAALASLPAPRFLASATPRRTSFLAFLLRRRRAPPAP